MHIKASKARGEDRSWVGETEHVPGGRDDWNETEAGHPHGEEVAQDRRILGPPQRTEIHSDSRLMRCWHGTALHYLQSSTNVTFNAIGCPLIKAQSKYCLLSPAENLNQTSLTSIGLAELPVSWRLCVCKSIEINSGERRNQCSQATSDTW